MKLENLNRRSWLTQGHWLVGLVVVQFLHTHMHAHAEVFKWTDKDGRTHYGDRVPQDKVGTSVKSANVASPTAAAEVEIEPSVMKYFDIYGRTPRELQASILVNGPFSELLQRHVNATCGWGITWKFDYLQDKGRCRINKFKITLSTVITFPRWQNPEAADDATRAIWSRASKEIQVHEDGHKANGIEAANVLARRLRGLQSFDSCEALSAEISKAGKQIYAEYSLIDRAYDRTEALKIRRGGRFAP